MFNDIFNMLVNNKEVIGLYLQILSTFIIGILAWTVARDQYCLSEKKARQDLYKDRYDNVYIVIEDLFSNCIELTKEYDIIKTIERNKTKALKAIKEKFLCIRECFYKSMNTNRFLIKKKDYDELLSFCQKFLGYVYEHIYGLREKEICQNYYVANCYNEHYKVIDKILSPYFYYGNESKLKFLIYKIYKYFKEHFHLFLADYFPTFCKIFSSIVLMFMLIFGCLFTLIELAKEYFKAPIKLKNFRLEFKLKMKSAYLKRNRPWHL